MKDKVSLRFLIFSAAALFLLVAGCIFFFFNMSYRRNDHIIQLPQEQSNVGAIYGADINGIQLSDTKIFSASDATVPLLVHCIPPDEPYQMSGVHTVGDVETQVNIYYADNKCKIVLNPGKAFERHVLILSDRYYTWSKNDAHAQEYQSLTPYRDAGFAFINISKMRGDQEVFASVDESSFGLSSISFAFINNRIRYTYTVSSQNGCIFCFTARSNGKIIEEYQISSVILGVPSDSQFVYPE